MQQRHLIWPVFGKGRSSHSPLNFRKGRSHTGMIPQLTQYQYLGWQECDGGVKI
jgi:hypothetical protein